MSTSTFECKIRRPDVSLVTEIQAKIDLKTKPQGALGRLESLVSQICLVQQTLTPELKKPSMLVFAGDHGLANEGISAYPQDVTWQMVYNFVQGGAAINVFCRSQHIDLKVVDAGVNHDFPPTMPIFHAKIRKSTSNALHEEAMTVEELAECIHIGKALANKYASEGCNCLGFGEMGIGNTSAASLVMAAICSIRVNETAGHGTGVFGPHLEHKIQVLEKVFKKHLVNETNPWEMLRKVGGFEMAMMAGAMLQAAENGILILIDGFIVSAVYALVLALAPEVSSYAVCCHVSNEQGHQKLLEYLKSEPILSLGLRLGEGTGVALAFPILQQSVAFMNEMASFSDAQVSTKI